MAFIANQGVIPRNIAGIYFLVDIHERDYYAKKQIFSTNQCGYELFRIMRALNHPFTVEELLEQFLLLLTEDARNERDQIKSDVLQFIDELKGVGYIREVLEDGSANN